jgi:glycosyltransferase involved in cell wall biosynthesis
MTNLKVCIFTETYYPVVGGGETQARALAEGLTENGFQVMVLTRRSHAALEKTEQFGGVTVHRLPPVGHQHFKKWGLLFASMPMLIRLHRQYDLIFVSGFRVVGMTAVIVSKLLGKTCVLKADSLGEMSGEFFSAGLAKVGLRPSSLVFRPFLWLRDSILKWADAFVAVSSEVAAELATYGVNTDIIYRIPNSVDTSQFCPVTADERYALRQKLGIPSKHRIVIFTGRLVSYKGLPLLVRVWKEIQRKHSSAMLLLVGSGGLDIHTCEAELKVYVSEQGLQERVHFTGNVRNVHEYLQASDIFVFPTESEAFGIALIEAMSCAIPVISTCAGGVKDIVQHKQNGLVVKPGDFRQLYEALDTLITGHSLSASLGTAARQTVLDRFSADTVTQQYVRLFRHASNPCDKALVLNQ